jgi:hypothetical protein
VVVVVELGSVVELDVSAIVVSGAIVVVVVVSELADGPHAAATSAVAVRSAATPSGLRIRLRLERRFCIGVAIAMVSAVFPERSGAVSPSPTTRVRTAT